MIISASRRTDIPSYYSEWFLNRIKEGYVLVRNPMSKHQISRINLSPNMVDGIVFWTKNPTPMLKNIHKLKDYPFYFQFTITPYGKDIEPSLPSKKETIIPTFKYLSDMIGPQKMVWRYDPILINKKYSIEYHTDTFEKMAKLLYKYTRKCTISFIDDYKNIRKNTKTLKMFDLDDNKKRIIARNISEIAHSYNLTIDTCAEEIDLNEYGIKHAKCIDPLIFEEIIGKPLKIWKDKNQRPACGCASSIDIGMYNTCSNGCVYCYANFSSNIVKKNRSIYNLKSPLLCGELTNEDIIKERKIKSGIDCPLFEDI